MCILQLHGQNVSLVDTVLKYCLSLKLPGATIRAPVSVFVGSGVFNSHLPSHSPTKALKIPWVSRQLGPLL